MNPDLAEPLLILAISLASAIVGYLFRSRCEQDIYERGYNAGLHRYHTSTPSAASPSKLVEQRRNPIAPHQ